MLELPVNSICFELKCILRDLYDVETEIPTEVSKTFANADELLRSLKKTCFSDLILTTCKELFNSIVTNLKKEGYYFDFKLSKQQIVEIGQCLRAVEKSLFFKEIEPQNDINSFLKELLIQLERNYENLTLEKKV